jgi:hypothetical protein
LVEFLGFEDFLEAIEEQQNPGCGPQFQVCKIGGLEITFELDSPGIVGRDFCRKLFDFLLQDLIESAGTNREKGIRAHFGSGVGEAADDPGSWKTGKA